VVQIDSQSATLEDGDDETIVIVTSSPFLSSRPSRGFKVPSENRALIVEPMSSFFIACGLAFASFVLATGRCLAKRKHYTFCLVMAAIECIFMPFGTVLGVFTIIALNRETVKRLFI